MPRRLGPRLAAGAALVAALGGPPLLAQPAVGFRGDIQPILDAHCVACHQSGAASAQLNLEEGIAYAALVGPRSQQSLLRLVAPGQPAASYLMRKLEGSHADAGGQGLPMPPLSPLNAQAMEVIRRWILNGAPDN